MLRPSLLALLVLLSCLSLAARAQAALKRSPLSEQPLALIGRHPSTEITRGFSGFEADAGIVEVHAQVSPLLDTRRSTFSVLLDDQPLDSFRLADAMTKAGELQRRVNLGHVSAGFHRIRFELRHFVTDDPCLLDNRDAAWTKLLPATMLEQTETENEPSGRGITVQGLVRSWQIGGEPVAIGVPEPLSRDVVLGYLEADASLAQLGLSSASVAPTAPRWELAVAPERVGGEPGLLGVLEAAGNTLRLSVKTAKDLPEAARILPADAARCPYSHCGLTRLPRTKAPTSGEPEASRVAVRFAELGMPRGWLAQGLGDHVLRVNWSRPANWALKPQAEVHLRVRTGDDAALDRARSRLLLRVNDRVLDSWSLDRVAPGEQSLVARLPDDIATASSLAVEVRVTLGLNEPRDCTRVGDEAAPWLALGPESELSVPRQETHYVGISAFYARYAAGRPKLNWPGELRLPVLRALANVLHPWAVSAPGQAWNWSDDCTAACVAVRVAPINGWFKLTTFEGSAHWAAPADTHVLTPAATTPILWWRNEDEPLHLDFASHFEPAKELPQLSPLELLGRAAFVSNDAWSAVLQETQPLAQFDVKAPRSTAERQQGDRERRYRLVNLLWAGLTLLPLLALAAWLLKFRRAGQPEAT